MSFETSDIFDEIREWLSKHNEIENQYPFYRNVTLDGHDGFLNMLDRLEEKEEIKNESKGRI